MLPANNGLQELESLIICLRTELEAYALKESANDNFIDKQNKVIEQLTSIYNVFSPLRFQIAWKVIEQKIAGLENLDKSLSGFYIKFRSDFKTDHFGIIEYMP